MKLKVDVYYESIEEEEINGVRYKAFPRLKAEMDLDVEFLEFLKQTSSGTLESILDTLRTTSSKISKSVKADTE